jgi:Ca-activated chloride channel homolog
MNVPLTGPLTLSGFRELVVFVYLLVILGLIGVYIVVQPARRKRVLRFANMELLQKVAPKQSTRWRHLPVASISWKASRCAPVTVKCTAI